MINLEPTHPGELLSQTISELGITQDYLAKASGVPPAKIHEIVQCRRSITADTALRVSKALGMHSRFLLNLQQIYDLDVARTTTDVSAIGILPEVFQHAQARRQEPTELPPDVHAELRELQDAVFDDAYFMVERD